MRRARATALEKGLDTVLNPLLDEVEQLLDRGCTLDAYDDVTDDGCPASQEDVDTRDGQRREASGQRVAWDSVRLGDLPGLFRLACGRDYAFGTAHSVREATAGMLRVLHAICVAGEAAEVRLAPHLCLKLT